MILLLLQHYLETRDRLSERHDSEFKTDHCFGINPDHEVFWHAKYHVPQIKPVFISMFLVMHVFPIVNVTFAEGL